ncbi:ATP-dependent helicase [Methanosphaerula palustris]|uniref:DNA 3'-5' helicase n=1 Tax=Methanosphaerula palustris (strain ATCC BAA-1556 / DSM 19958 / E1-9c) TaxID=521011 RepID=B8GG53_METPE|nr:ATP-dependent helicase [Methanosphaerula palustris]ACL16127.1 UvrD/REP helicase [Methanosphaerula palustris E1-9c]
MSKRKEELFQQISSILCYNHHLSHDDCYLLHRYSDSPCKNYKMCRIAEKTLEQLEFIVHSLNENSYLKACPGSGKTEVVGLKTAYEIGKWQKKTRGIAVLTFTNAAVDVIIERVLQFNGSSGISHPHFIGTIDSWLYGYILSPFAHLITHYPGDNEDRSIKIIENSSQAHFLQNRKFSIFSPTFKKGGKIFANQYYMNPECDKIYFSSGNIPTDTIRNNSSLTPGLVEKLSRMKQEFWKSGYLTHQDTEIICYNLLKENIEICKLIVGRFNHIIIDEYQDMSPIKIKIFNLLENQGTVFHFVGDINQSIFNYNNVNFEKNSQLTQKRESKVFLLTKNFRSVQRIVDTCSKIVNNTEDIKGEDDKPRQDHCLVFSYKKDTIPEISNLFESYLSRNNYDVKKSAILVRNNSRKEVILGQVVSNIPKAKVPPIAIYFWSQMDIRLKIESLNLIGKYLAANLFFDKDLNYRNYHCPREIKNYQWRIFLANVLESCNKSDVIADFSKKWTDWKNNYNSIFPKILENYQTQYDWIDSSRFDKSKIKSAPNNEKDSRVIDTIGTNKPQLNSEKSIQVSTIHSAKGKEFDAILLFSSDRSSSSKEGSGYWEDWLNIKNAKGESARLAYVASSRPKFLLAWAIPEKDYKDHNKIEKLKEYGFVPAGPFRNEESLFSFN